MAAKGQIIYNILSMYYEITKEGKIFSYSEFWEDEGGNSGPLYEIKPSVDTNGYPKVSLYKDGQSYTFYMHRLMAEKFIPNPENKPQVNHKNGNKLDYSIENLEWVTASENMKHAVQMGLCRPPVTKKAVEDTCTGKQYESLKDAAADLDIPYGTAKRWISGYTKAKTCLQYVQNSS